jgi:tetratricopeptide (TPR) repeat protein
MQPKHTQNRSKWKFAAGMAVAAIVLLLAAGGSWRLYRRWQREQPSIPGGITFAPVTHPDVSKSQASVRDHILRVRASLDHIMATNAPAELRAQTWAEMGRVYYAYEFYPAATSCFGNVVALAPTDLRAWYGLAECRFGSGDPAGAIKAMEQSLAMMDQAAPKPREQIGYAQRFLGDAFERAGQVGEARRRFEAVLAMEPEDFYSRVKVGRLLSQAGDRTGALSSFEKARKLAPNNREVAALLAMEYRKAGQPEKADALSGVLATTDQTRKVQELQRPDPWVATARALNQSSSAIYRGGLVAMRAGQHRQAAKIFEEVLRGESNNVPARVSLGFCKLALEDPVGAGDLFLAVVKEESTNELARKGLAQALAETGRRDEAIRFCVMWQTEQPKNAIPVETEAEVRDLARDYKGAAQAYQKLMQLDPSGVAGPMGLAAVQAKMGSPKEARKTLEAATAKLQGRGELLHLQARLLAASRDAEVRDPRLALKITEKLVADGALVTIWETHAIALAGNGRWDEAKKSFDAALLRFGKNGAPTLMKRLARVEAALNKHEPFTEPWPFADEPAR